MPENIKEKEIVMSIAISDMPRVLEQSTSEHKEKTQEITSTLAPPKKHQDPFSSSPIKNSYSNVKEHAYTQRKTIGDWQLGKTVGSGSMGKVKVVTHSITNEIAAVKIIPRPLPHNSPLASQSTQDYGKEIRTIREIAISSLLQHPYICTLRDVKIQPNHYYVFFEYINGGQMLDYIISHGKLKEKQARKFARQIGSALDYCHRNSIVHRDLKIENILISKEGDIKMIDFGLSNLYSPHSQLSTFCGSLYFAAPELLNAKAYIGPEIDIWSFGVVLYVLVCGKVPFDDQNMPALHAKIKRGHVEYPSWLTVECKQLLSRMLVTSPSQRATLSEILNHPWMTRGYDCPPDNYLPLRFPITFPLDMEIIRRMTGFEFGNEQTILTKLTNILESEGYRKLVKAYYSQSNDTHVFSLLIDKKKTFFDFYKRKLTNSLSHSPSSISDTVPQNMSKAKPVYIDAYHPLISIYYLVKEKIEREKKHTCQNPRMHAGDLFEASCISNSISICNHLDHKNLHSTLPTIKNRPFTIRTRARTYDEKEANTAIKNISHISSNLNHNVDNNTLSLAKESKEKNFKIFRRFSSRKIKERFSNFNHISVFSPLELLNSSKLSNKYSLDLESLQETGAKSPLTKQNNSLSINGPHLKRSVSINDNAFLSKSIAPSFCIPPISKIHSKEAKKNVVIENGIQSSSKASNVVQSSAFKRGRTKSLGHTKNETSQKEKKCQRQYSLLVMNNTPAASANLNQYISNDLQLSSSNQTYRSSHDVIVKSGFLKGIFSVSTTTSKPPHVIKNDLIRILSSLNISYRDIKGGFFCIYQPSIDLKNFATSTINSNTHIAIPNTHYLRRSTSLHKSNFEKRKTGMDINMYSIESDSNDSIDGKQNSYKHLNFTIQFEIYIVKVPLFSLHGLQFKRIKGNAWQYRSLASRIIAEMKL